MIPIRTSDGGNRAHVTYVDEKLRQYETNHNMSDPFPAHSVHTLGLGTSFRAFLCTRSLSVACRSQPTSILEKSGRYMHF